MSQVEATRLKSFAELAPHYGLGVPVDSSSTDITAFSALPPEEKVRKVRKSIATKDPLVPTLKTILAGEVIHMDPVEQSQLGIDVITLAPITADGQIQYEAMRSYNLVFVAQGGIDRLVITQPADMIDETKSRVGVRRYGGEVFTHDRLAATEIKAETPQDRYRHLVFSVKNVDAAIAEAKGMQQSVQAKGRYPDFRARVRRTTQGITDLNRRKYQYLTAALRSADELRSMYPYLPELYYLESDTSLDTYHAVLTMHIPIDGNFPTRVTDPDTPSKPLATAAKTFDTTINIGLAKQARNRANRGSKEPTDYVGHELCTLLGI